MELQKVRITNAAISDYNGEVATILGVEDGTGRTIVLTDHTYSEICLADRLTIEMDGDNRKKLYLTKNQFVHIS